MKALNIIFGAALAATVPFTPAPAQAQELKCTVQCLNPKGKEKDLKVSAHACIRAAEAFVQKECKGNGIGRYGNCYREKKAGKTVREQVASCR